MEHRDGDDDESEPGARRGVRLTVVGLGFRVSGLGFRLRVQGLGV